ncbi:MAG: hypothetical protein Q9180_001362, partial [Flavoplaca navasiana]
MSPTDDELNQIQTAVEVWLSLDPIPGGLQLARNKNIAGVFATPQLAQIYSGSFRRLPNAKFASKAPSASKDVVEDLLTHSIPPLSANAPPTFDLPLTPTALTPSDTAITPHDRSTDKAISKVPSKPLLLFELKVSKDAFARLEHREEEHAAAGQDEDGDLEPSDFKPSASEPSEFKGFKAAASEVYTFDDLGDNSDFAMSDGLVYNPMFDPDVASMGDLTGEGNRELAEEDNDDAHILFDAIKSSGPLLLDDRSGSRQSRSKQAL